MGEPYLCMTANISLKTCVVVKQIQSNAIQFCPCLGSISTWWCFGLGRPRPECNWVLCRDILDQNLIPFVRHHFQDTFCYQDDNAPAHRARVVRDFLEQEQIHTLYQPPLSLDCNTIEHLRDALQRAVDAKDVKPQNLRELNQALSEECQNMGEDTFRNLPDSMPQRIAAVARTCGGHTKY